MNNGKSELDAADRVDDLSGVASDGSQFLTFQLLEEEYGIDILQVQEIKNYSHITPIPNTPDYIKGAMNLRGTVVPIIDLRSKFDMPVVEYNQYTVIIVVRIVDRIVGMVVDAVSDVFNIRTEEIDPAPDMGAEVDTSFLAGLAKSGDRLITLLNIEKIVSDLQVEESMSSQQALAKCAG